MLTESADKVRVISLLSSSRCEELIRESDALGQWARSDFHDRDSGGMRIDRSVRDAVVLSERAHPDVFRQARADITERFTRFVGPEARPRFILSQFALVRYEHGGHYVPHRDSSPDEGVGNTRWRRYSIVCYLNRDFDEGGTTFTVIEQTFRPDVGKAILFPSYYFHAGDTVRKGRKYILTTYLGDPETAPINA
jgi:hypothetical protein